MICRINPPIHSIFRYLGIFKEFYILRHANNPDQVSKKEKYFWQSWPATQTHVCNSPITLEVLLAKHAEKYSFRLNVTLQDFYTFLYYSIYDFRFSTRRWIVLKEGLLFSGEVKEAMTTLQRPKYLRQLLDTRSFGNYFKEIFFHLDFLISSFYLHLLN